MEKEKFLKEKINSYLRAPLKTSQKTYKMR